MFAVVASAEVDSILPKPVTCVSFGSPAIGDQLFRQCHEILERLGNLRHIRVTNHMDLIPAFPIMAMSEFDTCYNLLFDEGSNVGTRYTHAGINVKLRSQKDSFDVSYPKVGADYFEKIIQQWESSPISNMSFNSWKGHMQYHQINIYSRRIAASKRVLKTIKLNDLYQWQEVVGDLCARVWY